LSGATYGSDASISDAELLTLDNGATTEILVGGGAGSAPVWTTAEGTGAPVRATSPTLTTPVISTSIDLPADAVNSAGELGTDVVTMDAIDADGDFSTLTGDWETTGMVAGGIRQYKDGAADGEISALNDTASVGSDGDPLVLTAREMTGNAISNLGAGGALYFLLPTATIGMHGVFNMDAAQEIHIKFPAGNDEGYWKDYDDTEFALGATGKDIQCNATPTIGDRVFFQTRKVASTIEYFFWSDVNGCIIEP
jgi:hypothetical protein